MSIADLSSIIADAKNFGFSNAAAVKVSDIRVLQSIRDLCTPEKCPSYGKNWACSPCCGTLEECESKIRQYEYGLLVQLTGDIPDMSDYPAVRRLHDVYDRLMDTYLTKLRTIYSDVFPMGSGRCKICEKCTCPDEPCRLPERRQVSMSSHGILVSEVCAKSGLPYHYGDGTLTFIGCYLVK